jgi:hypothetical protein
VLAEHIDESFDPSNLANATSSTPWVTKLHNLQIVEKGLVNYINKQDDETAIAPKSVNLEAIARQNNQTETLEVSRAMATIGASYADHIHQLLTNLLMASISGPSMANNIQVIQQLSGSAQKEIASIIMKVSCLNLSPIVFS